MRKLGLVVLGLVMLAGSAYWLLRSHSGLQDAIFQRMVHAAMAQPPDSIDGLRVVLCGTASPLGNDLQRAQACVAVLTNEHFFLIDAGARSPQRMQAAQLPMQRLTGVLLTHFHSDHIAAIPDVNLNSWVAGRASSLRVYGPSGVESVVAGLNEAYRLDRGYRTLHHGEALLPAAAGEMTAVPFTPGIVWQDDTLRVTAFSVDHSPVGPAVGYRLDYGGRSVVVSGDTIATDALFAAAQDADLVLHDALSRAMLDPMIDAARAAGSSRRAQIMQDVIDYHADSQSLATRAQAAGIKQLVLYHLVPVPPNALARAIFARGLPPEVLLANDLDRFDLPTGSTAILRQH